MASIELNLSDLSFDALFTASGLEKLDQRFLAYLQENNTRLSATLADYRHGKLTDAKTISQFIVDCAPILENFLAKFFDIEKAITAQREAIQRETVIFAFKKHFVLREAKRALKKSADLPPFAELDNQLSQQLPKNTDKEYIVAQYAENLLTDPQRYANDIQQLIDWCVQALATKAGQIAVKNWVSFHLPQRLDYQDLVKTPENLRHREGFELTDPRMTQREVLDEIHYCVYCHQNDGDFCSKGFPIKKSQPEQGFKINPLGETLTGCPLEEKISEMHVLKASGHSLAALATVMIDNPMCPATGHRICNDCMKACIYQKQDPVNIPQIETRVLTDVLALPWGVELYDLLVRWNPLRKIQWIAKPYNEKKVLVMGMGPAGFTLAHYLLMEGFAVVGAEGLKIEPLPKKYLTQPIYRYQDITEKLDERVMAGFGGVAEYGITVRWDKNFLKLIYISLMRRPHFQLFGSVRFGGTIEVEDAWKLGFDHLALAVGAGLPRELAIPNSLAPGMRQANDFLMALQLTGAAKTSSLANLQLRLPAVVIGGGLTGIDTATEVQAYYLTQIKKVYTRYHILKNHYGEEKLRSQFDAGSLAIIDEFLQHATELQQSTDNPLNLIQQWGGVSVVYRRKLQESPAYQRNHEEVAKALEEGIFYRECLSPIAVLLDEYGHVSGLKCQHSLTFAEEIIKAKAIFVATGAKPNVAYEFEHRGTFLRDGFQYQRFDAQQQLITENHHCKEPNFGAFTSYQKNDYRVSFLGDTHPVFHGSVVKAIASGKQIYPFIANQLLKTSPTSDETYEDFSARMTYLFEANVVTVHRLGDQLVELIVRAPLAAKKFQVGQFYRVQNYETYAQRLDDTCLQTEAMAMLAAPVAEDPDCLSFWVLERGVSSRLVASFQAGQPLSVMGPTGAKLKIPDQPETIMIIGGLMALAQLRSMGAMLKELGHRVLFVACADHQRLQTQCDVISQHSNEVLWVEQDWLQALSNSKWLAKIQRVIAVGDAALIQSVQQARIHFSAETKFFGSVFGAMQCMLKGVCAQCLQWQIDPVTGQRTKAVYACSWQEQPLERIDARNIDERLSQNRVQEKLANIWLDYLFEKCDIIRV